MQGTGFAAGVSYGKGHRHTLAFLGTVCKNRTKPLGTAAVLISCISTTHRSPDTEAKRVARFTARCLLRSTAASINQQSTVLLHCAGQQIASPGLKKRSNSQPDKSQARRARHTTNRLRCLHALHPPAPWQVLTMGTRSTLGGSSF